MRRTLSFIPFSLTTSIRAPSSISPSASACHNSPFISTIPSGFRTPEVLPFIPIIVGRPVGPCFLNILVTMRKIHTEITIHTIIIPIIALTANVIPASGSAQRHIDHIAVSSRMVLSVANINLVLVNLLIL